MAPVSEQSDFEQSDFEQSDFEQSDFEQQDIEQADIEQADIEQADIEQADIEQANSEQAASGWLFSEPLVVEQPVTVADKTFIQLRKNIVEGVIQSGSKLSETELSKKYSVSRAVIREAINRLESCHIVERKANVGARVVALSPQGLVELYQVRESLEGMAARLAAINMTREEIADLNTLLISHSKTVQTGENYYQDAGDVDFHYRIILGSKNHHLIAMLIDGIYHLIRMYRVQFGMAGPRVTTALDEHQHIVQAISNRDAELAEMLMRRHILYTRNSLEKKLVEQESLKVPIDT